YGLPLPRASCVPLSLLGFGFLFLAEERRHHAGEAALLLDNDDRAGRVRLRRLRVGGLAGLRTTRIRLRGPVETPPIASLGIAPLSISPWSVTPRSISALFIALLAGRDLLAFGGHAGARFANLVFARVVRRLGLLLRALLRSAAAAVVVAARMALPVV